VQSADQLLTLSWCSTESKLLIIFLLLVCELFKSGGISALTLSGCGNMTEKSNSFQGLSYLYV